MKSIAINSNSTIVQDFIEREQAKKMMAMYNSVFVMQLLLGISLLAAAHDLFTTSQAITWFCLHVLFLILRKLLIVWHLKYSSSEVLPDLLEHLSLGLVVCSSVVWGSTAFLLDFERYPQESVFVMAITLGIGVGATVLGAVWYRYFYYYLLPFMSLFIVAFLIGVPETSYLLAFVYIAFAVFALRTVNISYKNTIEHLSLVKENEMLVQTTNQFIAAASHDLRQPSQALSLLISALEESHHSVDRDKLIGHLKKSSNTLNTLLNNILDVSKLNSETYHPELCIINLNDIFKLLDITYRPRATAKSIELKVANTECWVETDPVMIERVLFNLLDNAITYTESGIVEVSCKQKGVQHVQVTVVDTGIGIEKDKQAFVFEPFYQVHNSERDSNKGFGLGLSIVQRITQKLDLALEFESTKEVGTRFAITLQRAEKPEVNITNETISNSWSLEKRRILVIEDNDTVLEGLILQLQNWGMQVVSATSSCEAMSKLRYTHSFDLILSDFRLKNGDNGMDVIDKIRAQYSFCDVPAIILSGDTGPDIIDEVAERGFIMLHKPTKPAHLRGVIQRCIFAS